MSNRRLIVTYNGKSSGEYPVTIGVPQGSNLGPVLFLLYVNDITQHVRHGTCNLFADDSIIYTTGDTIEEVTDSLQSNLDDVDLWYGQNRLILNADKSKFMLIHGKKKLNGNVNVSLGGQKINQVNHVKYLGIDVDDKLNWYTHLKNLHVRVMGKLAVLRRLSKILTKDIFRENF